MTEPVSLRHGRLSAAVFPAACSRCWCQAKPTSACSTSRCSSLFPLQGSIRYLRRLTREGCNVGMSLKMMARCSVLAIACIRDSRVSYS